MLDCLFCELIKLRRRKLFMIAAATAIFFPAALAVLFTDNSDTFALVISTAYQFTGFLLQMPLLTVLAVQLLFDEADCGALKNLLAVPVPRGALVGAKLLVLGGFSVAYSLTGYAVSAAVSALLRLPMEGMVLHLLVSLEFGMLCFFGVMPCIALLVWLNKSAVVSVLLTFFYTVANYVLGMEGSVIAVPLGLNAGSILPVAVMQRFIYGYIGHGVYYERIRPYLLSPAAAFAVLGAQALLCYGIAVLGYKRLAA